MIKEHETKFPVNLMCRCLNVSSSGYYEWKSRPESTRSKENRELLNKINLIFLDERSRAGSPRITKRLGYEGVNVGRHRVARLMQKAGLRAKAKKKFKATTNSNHKLAVSPNPLKQDFSAQAPNEKWVSDITYIWTDEGWLYLAVIVDLYSRLVVGWAMSERMTAKLVCDALTIALWRRKYPLVSSFIQTEEVSTALVNIKSY